MLPNNVNVNVIFSYITYFTSFTSHIYLQVSHSLTTIFNQVKKEYGIATDEERTASSLQEAAEIMRYVPFQEQVEHASGNSRGISSKLLQRYKWMDANHSSISHGFLA